MNTDSKTIAKLVVEGIMADILDRKGLRQAFEQIDEDIQSEITEDWMDIVETAIKQVTKKQRKNYYES